MNKVEVAEGKDLRVRFYGRRCIHSRYCVLWAPNVFKANTPGEWIFPDAMSTDTGASRCVRVPLRRDPVRPQGWRAGGGDATGETS